MLGSAGSNRIRSALLQTILGVVDHGLSVSEAIEAPRVHFENDIVFAEPGIDLSALSPGTRDGLLRRAEPVLRRCPGGPQPRRGAERRRRPAPRRRRGDGMRRLLGVLRRSPASSSPSAAAASRRRTCSSSNAAEPGPNAQLTMLVNEEGGDPLQRRRRAEAERPADRQGAGDPGRTEGTGLRTPRPDAQARLGARLQRPGRGRDGHLRRQLERPAEGPALAGPVRPRSSPAGLPPARSRGSRRSGPCRWRAPGPGPARRSPAARWPRPAACPAASGARSLRAARAVPASPRSRIRRSTAIA